MGAEPGMGRRVGLLSALWLAPLALWLANGHPDPGSGPLDTLYFAITALFWIGHRLGSAWLAYATEAYRPLLRAAPVRFILLPLLVTATCFAILLPADRALPLTRAERFTLSGNPGLCRFDLSFWGTAFRRPLALPGKNRTGGRSRNAAAGPAVCPWRGRGAGLSGGRACRSGRLPKNSGSTAGFSAGVRTGPGTRPPRRRRAFAVRGDRRHAAGRAARARHRSLPRILYILGLALMVVIALQPRSLFLFVVIWTSQHWIVASGLTSRVPRLEPSPAKGCLRRTFHALNSRGWALIALVMLVSILLLPVFEVEANWPDTSLYYGDRIFGHFAAVLRTSSLVPVLLALGFASGFVHYMLDRSVYRLSDRQVRLAARGLLAT